jgi:hypothetical protein
MRRVSPADLIILVLGVVFSHIAHAEDGTFANPPEKGRQVWFLTMLKTLADSDGLDDPVKVGAILGAKFDKNVVTTSPSHMESFANSFERDEYTPETTTWFLAGPGGYASTGNFRPNGQDGFALGVDPVAKGGKVNFKYFQSKRFGLPEVSDSNFILSDGVKNDSQVSIIFYGIDKLTCVTLQDVRRQFPGITHMAATDVGAERYLYYPRAREEAGAVLSFVVPEGSCVSDASVDDFSAFGMRHARAQYKFIDCAQKSAREFCSGRPHASARDLPLQARFNAYIRSRCVSLNAFYDKEPRTNREPPGKIDYSSVPTYCSPPR